MLSTTQGPSEPIKPTHPWDYKYELHDCKVLTQPFPVVRQPDKNFEQSALVESVFAASVHVRGLQTVDP